MAVMAMVSTVSRVSHWFAAPPNMSVNAWARMAAARCCSGVDGRVRQIAGATPMSQDKALPTAVIQRQGRSKRPVSVEMRRPVSVGSIL